YAERSVSDTGAHCIARGTLPEGARRRGRVEVYEEGRYFAMTGRRIPGTPAEVNERTAALAALHAEHVAAPEPPRAAPVLGGASPYLSDEDVIEKARGARNGGKFQALWAGDHSPYGSRSE